MGRRRSESSLFVWILFVGVVLAPFPGRSQVVEGPSVQTNPSSVSLGQLLHLEIRVRTPQGWVMEGPDSIVGLRGIHSAGPPRVDRIEIGPDSLEWTLAYPLVPLRTGYRPLPSLGLRVRALTAQDGGGSTRRVQVPLGGISVQTVLPPPGSALEPSGPMSPSPPGPRPSSAAFLTLLGALMSGAAWMATRRRPGEYPVSPLATPTPGGPPQSQDSLLARLQEILRTEADSPSDALKIFDETGLLLKRTLEGQTSSALTGLTTPELVILLSEGRSEQEIRSLERALRLGDHARFREALPTPRDLRGFQQELISWTKAAGPRSPGIKAGGRDA